MDMMVNRLPSKTWNRLGMNESPLKIDCTLTPHTPAVTREGTAGRWEPRAGADYEWAQMITGMGPDVHTLTRGADLNLLETAPGEKMDAPVLLRYAYANGEQAASRLRLKAGADSELSAVLLLTAPDRKSAGLSAIQIRIQAERGAKVRLYVAQLLGDGFLCLNDVGGVAEEGAAIELVKLELGAGRLYAGAAIDLSGRESVFDADVGCYVREDRLCDMNYLALHHGARTQSTIEVSDTLEEGARKCFRGTIDFQKGCSGSKGTESENVLLLGEQLVNQTIPLILCKEEDVEGNHGASIGRLDDRMLFYLASRGIDEEAARQLIAQARIDAVCNRFPIESVRTAVHQFKL